ncbi:MAG: hypothetical protein COW42_13975 [Deltaproteobacteria bacterium CG17_big_fil_post_rev_8_21_14_2_50_63_7]|nr:MAG: hypothetical protein COW42_13975 [Deltaproteobacteria bacterium CG17_big_fil_post_rev_8_21_14_2_50_63_7]
MSYDYRIQVNLSTSAQAVAKKGFGAILIATDDATFTGGDLVRRYTKNADAQADDELGATAKAAVAAAFSQQPNVGDIAVGKLATFVAGALDAILAADDDWYGLTITSRTKADILAVAAWVEACDNDVMFGALTLDADVFTDTLANVAETLSGLNYSRTFLVARKSASWADIAVMAKFLACDPDVSTTIAAHKTLAGETADKLTATEVANLRANNVNGYGTLRKVAVFNEGVLVDGAPIDTLVSRDWLTARVAEAGAQLQVDNSNLNKKVPFSDIGIGMVEGTARNVALRGELIGHFRKGSTQCDPPLLADVAEADITARHLDLPLTVTLEGAIESTTFYLGTLFS